MVARSTFTISYYIKTFCFFAPLVAFFLHNRETSAIVLAVVIIPFYARRSIKRNNEKKIVIQDYTRFYLFVSQNEVDRTNPK